MPLTCAQELKGLKPRQSSSGFEGVIQLHHIRILNEMLKYGNSEPIPTWIVACFMLNIRGTSGNWLTRSSFLVWASWFVLTSLSTLLPCLIKGFLSLGTLSWSSSDGITMGPKYGS